MAQVRTLVVGGGVMGLATGCALTARGAAVTVLERQTVAHDWASSHGLTRAIRHEYGPQTMYTAMVARSLLLWEELARASGLHLYTETGVLTLGQSDDGHTLAGLEVMRAAGLPVERLTADACAARFPQFQPAEYSAITYNPRGGMLHVHACMRALVGRLRANGGVLREGARVVRVEPSGSGARVALEHGESLSADRVIVTAGPWVHDVLPELRLPVRATRQQVCYLSSVDAAAFAVGRFPVFLAQMEEYGFPLQGPGWLKVGLHTFGATVNPDSGYAPDLEEVERLRVFLRRVLPGAAGANVAQIDRCMYDVTPDEDFILDTYPAAPGVVIGSGFSGHGFKFGVLIGELLAALACEEGPEFPLDRFRLARFAGGASPA
jgi:monomeric sarcosine oxidase